jgi:protein TonB
MGPSSPISAGLLPATPPFMNARIVWTLSAVVLLHAALVAALVLKTGAPARHPVELQTITAQLLSPETTDASSAGESAAQPKPMPKPVPPPAVAKSKPQHSPAKAPVTRPPTPVKSAVVAAAPAQAPMPLPTPLPTSAPTPANPAPAAESAQRAPAPTQAAPTISARGPALLASSAPKSIEHVECAIVKPDYPDISRRRGETGTVSVRFVIGISGTIENVEVAKSSGYERLDDAALTAMRGSSCHPYVENGAPIRVMSTQPFTFALDD